MDKGAPPPPGFVPQSAFVQPPPPPPYNEHPETAPPHVAYMPAFGSESQRMTCPHCRASISTEVKTEPNIKTHAFALALCIFGLWCFVCCPYCMDSCMTKKHYCPNCKAFLGEQS